MHPEKPAPDADSEKLITIEIIRADAAALEARSRNNDDEITADDMVNGPLLDMAFLADPLLQQVGLACLAGSSDTGKSTLLRQLSLAVAAGDSHFLGFPLAMRHRSVVYVSTEDGHDITCHIIRRQRRAYSDAQIHRLRFVFDTEELLLRLDRNLTNLPADLVIIDCFGDVYSHDIKDSQRVRAFLHAYHLLAEQHRCLVLFLHHTGKRTEHLPPSKNNLLGSQAFEAKMRLVIELRRDQLRPHARHLCIVKGNYLPGHYKTESYVLHFDESSSLFAHSGERIPFELLTRSADADEGRAKYDQALDLKKEGKSYSQIAEAMGYASKSSIATLFEKAKKMGWDADPDDDQEE